MGAGFRRVPNARPPVCPVQPDRCQWFAVGGRSLGWRGLCAIARRDQRERPRRRTFTANNRRHRWTGHPHRSAKRSAGDRVTAGNHRPAGSGDSRPASAAAPGSAPAREGEAQPTPRARTDPRPFSAPAPALVVMLAPTHSSPGTSRLQHSISCAGSACAWREPQASALEAVKAVKKFVTDPYAWRRTSVDGSQFWGHSGDRKRPTAV